MIATLTDYMATQADPAQRERVIVHSLDGTWQTEESFPAIDYSRFKYGCGAVARRFGEEMADAFAQTDTFLNFQGTGDDIIITASPYKYIAPAASAIKKYFTNRLNSYLVERGLQSANIVKMTRSVLFEGDYGKLTEEARTALLKRDKLSIDRDFVAGKLILVLDDIKITGSHEEKVVSMFLDQGVEAEKMVFLYYAELQNPAEVGANYENYLNHFLVKSMDDLLPIVTNANFILNARVCKYLLSTRDYPALANFICNAGKDFGYNLLAAIIGDGYHTMPMYENNFHLIRMFVKGEANSLVC